MDVLPVSEVLVFSVEPATFSFWAYVKRVRLVAQHVHRPECVRFVMQATDLLTDNVRLSALYRTAPSALRLTRALNVLRVTLDMVSIHQHLSVNHVLINPIVYAVPRPQPVLHVQHHTQVPTQLEHLAVQIVHLTA